ncbi:RrF2 family transcriptional regulator [Halanaerobium hydrogeniformans]|uniref:Transcriptional regulator, BadM/Rrf2 family n=1 Tax=Halanaerobium hydrogeniformans TaxID=656519 RepID=E4RIS0_HALHG|nr:Rrf2 family transcriptional regulator [Halanaerobium hydrogeniformans]ADQ15140.1 transcriptional regulator, BadM/Rrf2 family [Halanaerobium hydrogeniformans]
MEISSQARYGLRALMYIAASEGSQAIPLREIAEKQNISERYLEQLFAKLKKADLVKGIRGAHGGYLLNQSPEEITAADILKVLEGPVISEQGPEKISSEAEIYKKAAYELWNGLENLIFKHLAAITLADLSKRAAEIKANNSDGYIYHI